MPAFAKTWLSTHVDSAPVSTMILGTTTDLPVRGLMALQTMWKRCIGMMIQRQKAGQSDEVGLSAELWDRRRPQSRNRLSMRCLTNGALGIGEKSDGEDKQ